MASEIKDGTIQQALDEYLATVDRPAVPCDGSCQGFCDEHAEKEYEVYTQAQMDTAITTERERIVNLAELVLADGNEIVQARNELILAIRNQE